MNCVQRTIKRAYVVTKYVRNKNHETLDVVCQKNVKRDPTYFLELFNMILKEIERLTYVV